MQKHSMILHLTLVFDYVCDIAKDYDRIDIIADQYFSQSLRSQTREGRGHGETSFPTDFTDNFLRNNENKSRFNVSLAERDLGESVCKALPFFFAFSGCDTVSSIFNQGKTRI